jgi:hypothetical protein
VTIATGKRLACATKTAGKSKGHRGIATFLLRLASNMKVRE